MLLELNELEKGLISRATQSITVSEHMQRDVFLMVVGKYKDVKKNQRGAITTQLQKQVALNTKLSVVKGYYTRIFKTAQQYCDMFLLTKNNKLLYTNISHSVKLMVGVQKLVDDVSKATSHFTKKDLDYVRTELAKVWVDGMSDYSYNNLMEAKITTLKGKYKLVETEGEFIIKDFFGLVKSGINNLNEAQLLELLGMVQDKYDTIETVQEVA